MGYSIQLSEDAGRVVQHFHPTRKQAIKEALRTLMADPYQGKPLEKELAGYYAYRVLRFRIVYTIHDTSKKISVAGIGPRASIYEDLQETLLKLKKK